MKEITLPAQKIMIFPLQNDEQLPSRMPGNIVVPAPLK